MTSNPKEGKGDKVKNKDRVTGTCQTDLTSLRSSLELILTYFDGTQLILVRFLQPTQTSDLIVIGGHLQPKSIHKVAILFRERCTV